MHITQEEYARTQAVYNVARDKANIAIVELDLSANTDDAGWAQISEIENVLGVWPAFEAFKHAEEAMIAWAHNAVMNDPKTARKYQVQREMLDCLFNNYRRLPHIADKLAQICFRLAV